MFVLKTAPVVSDVLARIVPNTSNLAVGLEIPIPTLPPGN